VLIEIDLAPRGPGAEPPPVGRSLLGFRPPASAGAVRLLAGALISLLVVGLVGFGYRRSASAARALTIQIQQEVSDSMDHAGRMSQIEFLRAQNDTIVLKIEAIRRVDRRRYVWPRLLDEISRALPAHTWLTEISEAPGADTTDSGPVFTLQGNAGSTLALTRYMKNLEDSPYIRDVTLITAGQVEVDGLPLQRFALEARHRAPEPERIVTVPHRTELTAP
jgi:Tfp pilus assembly protein PilN